MNTPNVPSVSPKLLTLQNLFNSSKRSLTAVLPKHLTPERVIKTVLVSASRTPKLLECTPISVLMATMKSAELGLEPNTPLNYGYLIPYGNTCEFIVGYQGLIELALRSGKVKSIYARAVHEKDGWECVMGASETLKHTPAIFSKDRGPIIGVYAVAILTDGTAKFEVMSIADVNLIRDRSRAKNSGPWVTDFEAMSLKTVIRRLCKTLPKSIELAKAVENDEAVERGEIDSGIFDFEDSIPVDVEKPKTRTEKVAEKLGASDPVIPRTSPDPVIPQNRAQAALIAYKNLKIIPPEVLEALNKIDSAKLGDEDESDLCMAVQAAREEKDFALLETLGRK